MKIETHKSVNRMTDQIKVMGDEIKQLALSQIKCMESLFGVIERQQRYEAASCKRLHGNPPREYT